MYETDQWPFVQAKHFKKVTNGKRPVRLIVIHSVESPETFNTAENVAKYFQTTERPASAHVIVDSDSVVQCVKDNDIAAAAPGANQDGIHIELAGYARQTREQWLDSYGLLMLERAADVVAQYTLKYEIEPKHLLNSELAKGDKGIVGHYQITEVYRRSTHTDPGQHYPWDYFITRVVTNRVRRLKMLGAVASGSSVSE